MAQMRFVLPVSIAGGRIRTLPLPFFHLGVTQLRRFNKGTSARRERLMSAMQRA